MIFLLDFPKPSQVVLQLAIDFWSEQVSPHPRGGAASAGPSSNILMGSSRESGTGRKAANLCSLSSWYEQVKSGLLVFWDLAECGFTQVMIPNVWVESHDLLPFQSAPGRRQRGKPSPATLARAFAFGNLATYRAQLRPRDAPMARWQGNGTFLKQKTYQNLFEK